MELSEGKYDMVLTGNKELSLVKRCRKKNSREAHHPEWVDAIKGLRMKLTENEQRDAIKVIKDKNDIVIPELLTGQWTDWIDYWSVDFNFESKREILNIKNEETRELEEHWAGDFIFGNDTMKIVGVTV
jgi:hypothetical protein